MVGRSYKARKLPADAEQNGWFSALSDPLPARRIEGAVKVDFAVVGAGICGLTAARRLGELQPDASVALIEATRVGFGTSGRNAGFLLKGHSHGGEKDMALGKRNDRLCEAGLEYIRNTVMHHQIQCQWSDWGRIYVASGAPGETHLNHLADGLEGIGTAYSTVDRDEMESITGTRFYSRGIRADGTALMQPAALMRGLGATLPANVTLYEESPVTEIYRGDGVQLVCSEGEVQAKQAILANHVFAEELGIARFRVVPVSLYASLTRPLTEEELQLVGGGAEFGLLPSSPNGSTVRLTQDGRILMRNTLTYGRSKRFGAAEMATALANHREGIRRRWPDLVDIELDGTWGGILGFTRNGGIVCGEMAPSLYAVMTTDAAPLTRGAAAAKLLAEQICGVDSALLQDLNRLPRAALLPPDPFLRMIVNRRLHKNETAEANEL
ncbi:MAG: FAD-dependent oxidoreductase [Rhodospirillaceae bacterium]|nr:FAD-dependent oxidoreductase [Rhodospirillaceae bacterium]|tara:strand:+ start:1465 stop:2784 length:1320 start_codon:yes stop_codon:yes gene_type:complete